MNLPSSQTPPTASHPSGNCTLVRGPHFTYLLPRGWTVGEEGNFALVLRSADFTAGVIVFGQSGLLQPMSPQQFAHAMMAGTMRLAPDVQFGPARPIPPMPGCNDAAVFETSYTLSLPAGPMRTRGLVFCNVAVGYGQCNGVLTLAASDARQWEQYMSWLPKVAVAAVNTGPNPYGSTTMAGVIHGITARDYDVYQQHQSWSQQLWTQVVEDRHRSADRRSEALGPMLTGQEWLHEGFGGPDIRRSTTPACIWRSRDGRETASDDPVFDPRSAGDTDWVRVR